MRCGWILKTPNPITWAFILFRSLNRWVWCQLSRGVKKREHFAHLMSPVISISHSPWKQGGRCWWQKTATSSSLSGAWKRGLCCLGRDCGQEGSGLYWFSTSPQNLPWAKQLCSLSYQLKSPSLVLASADSGHSRKSAIFTEHSRCLWHRKVQLGCT